MLHVVGLFLSLFFQQGQYILDRDLSLAEIDTIINPAKLHLHTEPRDTKPGFSPSSSSFLSARHSSAPEQLLALLLISIYSL